MVTIRPLQEADLDAADRVMRLAFGTFLGLMSATIARTVCVIDDWR